MIAPVKRPPMDSASRKMKVERAVDLIVERLRSGGKVWTFGCGGQMANAMHFAAELSGKFEEYEDPLPCVCLGTNPCELTAITNDFGWEWVFQRLIASQARKGDVVVGFTVSGQAAYYSKAVGAAVSQQAYFVNVTGAYGVSYEGTAGVIDLFGDWFSTPEHQEEQLSLVHHLCGHIKRKLARG